MTFHLVRELDDDLLDHARDGRFSGVVCMTQGTEERFARAYGCASRAWHVPNTLSTRFATASVSQLFMAVAILQLVDNDVLTLDTRA